MRSGGAAIDRAAAVSSSRIAASRLLLRFPYEPAMLGVIALLLAALLIVSLRLSVDYFDAYQNLLNARAIVMRTASDYSIYRGILYPVFLLPATLIGALVRSEDLIFLLAHLSAFLLFGGLLTGTFALLRTHLSRAAALFGTLLLAANPLVIANASMAKEDIPGAAFISAAMYFYWRARRNARTRDALIAGALAGCAAGLRYQLLPLWLLLVIGFEILAPLVVPGPRPPGFHRISLPSGLCLLVVPVVVLGLMPVVVYPLIGRGSPAAALGLFAQDIRLVADAVRVNEGSIQDYRFIVKAVTAMPLACALLGVIAGWRTRSEAALFHGLWFFLVFMTQTYAVGHKEARFLLPAFPSLYALVAMGLSAALGWMRRRRDGPAMAALLIVVVVALPAANAVGALLRFGDPVYGIDYEAAVSRSAARLTTGRVLWIGPPYSLHPRARLFDRGDPFTYIYDDYAHVTTFWTGRASRAVASVTFVEVAGVVYPDQGLIGELQDGDALIINLEPSSYQAANVPTHLRPLVIERTHVLSLASQPGPDASAVFGLGGATVTVQSTDATVALTGAGLPDGAYELEAGGASAPRLATASAVIVVRDGAFRLVVPADTWAARPPGAPLRLVAFEDTRRLSPPGQ